jgi:hypothetical protein
MPDNDMRQGPMFGFKNYLKANGIAPPTDRELSDLRADLDDQRLSDTELLVQRRDLTNELMPEINEMLAEQGEAPLNDEEFRDLLDSHRAEIDQIRAGQNMPPMNDSEWIRESTDLIIDVLDTPDDDTLEEEDTDTYIDENGLIVDSEGYVVSPMGDDEYLDSDEYEVVDSVAADYESGFAGGAGAADGVRAASSFRADGELRDGLQDDEDRIQATADVIQDTFDRGAIQDAIEAGGDGEGEGDDW